METVNALKAQEYWSVMAQDQIVNYSHWKDAFYNHSEIIIIDIKL